MANTEMGGECLQVVYIDVLFVVNLAMDFLSLYLTGRLLRLPIMPGKLLLGAAIGGGYGVLAFLLDTGVFLEVVMHLGISFLLCLVLGYRPLIRCVAVLHGMGFLLGGGMSAMFMGINHLRGGEVSMGVPQASSSGGIDASATALALCAVALALVIARMMGAVRRSRLTYSARVMLAVGDRRLHCTCTVDSAHFLTEPISGEPVVLLPVNLGRKLFPSEICRIMEEDGGSGLLALGDAWARVARIVPMSGVTGQRMAIAIRPDRCEIEGRACRVYLGIAQIPCGLIPADLVENKN